MAIVKNPTSSKRSCFQKLKERESTTAFIVDMSEANQVENAGPTVIENLKGKHFFSLLVTKTLNYYHLCHRHLYPQMTIFMLAKSTE